MDFLEKTLEGLNIRPDDRRLSSGFDFDEQDNKEEDCVLIIGLNPAGGENDVRREKNGSKPYFYSFKERTKGNISDYVSNKYFRPIYDFVNRVIEGDAKWQWCSKKRSEIVEQINRNDDLIQNKEAILRQYDEDHNKSCVIYVGDIFYYHETDSKNLPYASDPEGHDYHSYSEEMLRMHIQILKKHKKRIKFIYINNTQVSRWLCKNNIATQSTIDGVRIFYGGMLSGQRAMDSFARERLIKEISEAISDH